ncbi:hypothetical protein B0A54_14465 [Friedmanniomyces endolithicus]|uniref:FAD/NAD(P)-binding domain-containing protein n=1 Tax=Friedmanniomyces endolithicus TaxID=329885 RepID=A0A4U0UAS3_9PEZI|nr:hypothetical protein B0A54_14465 [Friedmanniomyces endolithicus]
MGDPGEMMDPVTNPKLKRELREYGKRGRTDGPYADNLEVDALVVGGGFAGVFMFYTLRKAGLKTVIHRHRYNWPNNYPGYKELRDYFDHCDKVLDIKSQTAFESVVTDAHFNTEEGRWSVKTADGRTAKTKYLVICAGFAAKRYVRRTDQWSLSALFSDSLTSLKVPPWDGIDKFKGIVHHSSFWPDEEIDVTGKRCDYLFDAKANRVVYDFWAKKQRARINDPAKRDILAPLEPPHPWGVKRPCLEHSYFEQYNRDNVEPVSLKGRTIECFNETGIKLSDGSQHDFDIICIATGFDVVTGGMTAMGLHSINGESLESQWKKSAHTYLGTTVSGYPNQFHIYGPQGPTLLSNGPTSVEVQGRWIADVIKKCETEGIKYINPTDEASKEWKKRINYLSELTLMPTTKSTYMGGSDPNKAFEQTCYAGGLYAYGREIRAVLPDLKGFDIVKN